MVPRREVQRRHDLRGGQLALDKTCPTEHRGTDVVGAGVRHVQQTLPQKLSLPSQGSPPLHPLDRRGLAEIDPERRCLRGAATSLALLGLASTLGHCIPMHRHREARDDRW